MPIPGASQQLPLDPSDDFTTPELGLQWGFWHEFDTARFTTGKGALIPCGVLRPGCKGLIGNGVVLDPIAFLGEVDKLRKLHVAVDERLFVSNRAQVILPYHRMIELAAECAPGRQKIGTTSKGIGPAY